MFPALSFFVILAFFTAGPAAVFRVSGAGASPTPKRLEQSITLPQQASAAADLFVDITAQSGINFVHYNGSTGKFFLPEITGSGGALFDYDNDGDLDLIAIQGTFLIDTPSPTAIRWEGKAPPRSRLFRNDLNRAGEVHFTDVTEESGIRALGYGMGAAVADFNNDGWTDLYITNLGANQLWQNNGNGTFTDVTRRSGCDDPRWSTSATFFDYDRDGWMDLFVAHYVDFSIHLKRECFSPDSALDYCGPAAYDPVGDRLFHNLGNGTFEDVTVVSGISKTFGPGLGAVAADFDNDGWTDVFVANDGDYNQLWKNMGGTGVFENIALLSGVAVNQMGQPEASMGVTAEDFDNDGDVDLFMTHLERESNTFYLNQGGGLFEDQTSQLGLHAPSLRYTSFGTCFFDYDNDGWFDLLVLNGAVRTLRELARQGDPYPLHQRNQLFQNDGRSHFVEVTQNAGAAFELSEVSRGAAVGDIDNDGDSDIVIFNNNGPTRLLQNRAVNNRHWIGFQVMADHTNQTRIEAHRTNGTILRRRVHTDGSYLSAADPRVLIGLGNDEKLNRVRIDWPDGTTEQFEQLPLNRYWLLRQGSKPAELGAVKE